MSLYKRFQQLGVDTAAIGFAAGSEFGGYFCTPTGARVFGWAGVDGIHFCFVRGFGDMVFAVNPMDSPDGVHPLARSFEDFLRLVLACGSADALEQAHAWSQEQFEQFLHENPRTSEQDAVLQAISSGLSLTPMKDPFTYITTLEAEFDKSQLKYPKEYKEYNGVMLEPNVSEWKVYFSSGFSGGGRERAGREMAVHRQFIWGDELWLIPAVYSCGKGLVIDFCAQVAPERIRLFMEKWNLMDEAQIDGYTEEQREQIKAKNPLNHSIDAHISFKGKTYASRQGYGTVWNPCLPKNERMDIDAKRLLEHYELDPAFGWVFWRMAFPLPRQRKAEHRAFNVTLSQEPVAIPGPRFCSAKPGKTVTFTHPMSGVQHVLTIESCEQQETPRLFCQDREWELPTRFTAIQFTLSPDLPASAFFVTDCAKGDHPKRKLPEGKAPDGAASIGIVGGADGPTVISMLRVPSGGRSHSACSALRFEWADDVEWRMVFHEKQREDRTVEVTLQD